MTCGFAILPGNDHLWNKEGECSVCHVLKEGKNSENQRQENVQSEKILQHKEISIDC